jgi:spermidine synthase
VTPVAPPAARGGGDALPAQARALWQPAALVLMAASGAAALAYQMVWTRQAAQWLGHDAAAVLAVVAAFFGGLALGAWALGARVEASARPAHWYAGCEAVIGLWSVVLALAIGPASRVLLALSGADADAGAVWPWAVAFVGTFLLLLPATAAMGATLPAMERLLAHAVDDGHARIAALYAANTAGAVAGVIGAVFWALPAFGLTRTALAAAALSLLCALGTPWLFRGDAERPTATPAAGAAAGGRHRPLLMAATGLLGIGYEVVAVRVLSQVSENTVYTFAQLLALYLAGTALGAAWWHRRARRRHEAEAATAGLLVALALSVLLGATALWTADGLKPMLHAALAGVLAPGVGAALGAEAGVALLAFALPTFMMGALFAHLAAVARAGGIGLGAVLAVNTFGAAWAPWLFGVLAVPAFGAKGAVLLIASGYLALAVVVTATAPAAAPRHFGATVGALASFVLLSAFAAPPLRFVDVPEGGHVVKYLDGARASVSVVADSDGTTTLRIDNRQQEGSSATWVADARQALLPLLLHPAPRQALFLGLGTGVTATAATLDARLQVLAVELLPEVVEASTLFRADLPDPGGRLAVRAADARRYVRATESRLDLIVADNFHPARSGSATLYTVEHFQALRARLAADGLVCQWLPLHQLDLATLRVISRSFLEVFPTAALLLATDSLDTPVLGLVAREGDRRLALDAIEHRLSSAQLTEPAAAFGLHDAWALAGSVVAGPAALRAWSRDAPLNTDDRPLVAWWAPYITYAPGSRPRERLLALLDALPADAADVFGPAQAATAAAARWQAYAAARRGFLAAGRDVQARADVTDMLAQVRTPLLDVLRTSPDYRPAYDPLLRMAQALAERDPKAARALADELARVVPKRGEARELRQRLDARP